MVFVIGIAGGSGSGKTYLSNRIVQALGTENVTHICYDSYYRDLSHKKLEERAKNNFDHPDSLEFELLIEHLRALKTGHEVSVPTYDFKTHCRRPKEEEVVMKPRKIVLLEGVLIMAVREIREELDARVFVETEADLRFIRRLLRDKKERGRQDDDIVAQYLATVKPMHREFVDPSKHYCDIIIPGESSGDVAFDMIVARLRQEL